MFNFVSTKIVIVIHSNFTTDLTIIYIMNFH